MKKLFLILTFLLTIELSFAHEITSKVLHRSGVYGQTFELTEYSDGSKCQVLLYMGDNLTKITKTYDPSMETVYCIRSKWFSNPSEYSKAIEASKQFFDVSLDLIYLADMKDICDIAPCCKSTEYKIREWAKTKKKFIYIEYDCSDLELLFEIAGAYTAKSRDYVLENYVK